MATFLDALADLVSEPSARTEYHRDPAGWLAAHDAAELCAEDVRAAEPILRRWFPDAPLATPFDAVPGPAAAATDLDAAIVTVDHLLSGLPGDPDGDPPDGSPGR